eukprot:12014544-Alexandrium_andersonii.AAC.1
MQGLRTISHIELTSRKSEELCGPELDSLHRSLLGAVAYLTLTHVDVAVFASALQRWRRAPQ